MLAYLKQYRKQGGPHMIIVPKSTSTNWLKEVARWTNNLTHFRFHGNAEERDALKPQVKQHDITVTTYEMVIMEKTFFSRIQWNYVIVCSSCFNRTASSCHMCMCIDMMCVCVCVRVSD